MQVYQTLLLRVRGSGSETSQSHESELLPIQDRRHFKNSLTPPPPPPTKNKRVQCLGVVCARASPVTWLRHCLQEPFMQSKLSLTMTLTRGNCGAVVAIIIRTLGRRAVASHACRNVARRLKRIETIQTIEHCGQCLQKERQPLLLITSYKGACLSGVQNSHTEFLYGVQSKFTPRPMPGPALIRDVIIKSAIAMSTMWQPSNALLVNF